MYKTVVKNQSLNEKNVLQAHKFRYLFFMVLNYQNNTTTLSIGHDLGQRVRIIQKRNRFKIIDLADLKILSLKVSFCGFMESQERILHWIILAATGGLNFQ